VFLTHSSH